MTHVIEAKPMPSSSDLLELLRYSNLDERIQRMVYDLLDTLDERDKTIETLQGTLNSILKKVDRAQLNIDDYQCSENINPDTTIDELSSLLSDIEEIAEG